MLGFRGNNARLCDHLTRRDLLRIGALAPLGLSLPWVLRAEAQGQGSAPTRAKARSIVLFYLLGGQGQLDTWDMRPEAPEEIRGEFRPIATRVPGTFLCEHMPRLAAMADRFAIVRTMNHTATVHNAGAYQALTGERPPRDAGGLFASSVDHPHPGAIVAKYAAHPNNGVPPFIQLSEPVVGDNFGHMPGTGAGFLKALHDPLIVVGDPNRPDFSAQELALPDDVSAERLSGRRRLLASLDRQLGRLADAPELGRLDAYQQRALTMVTSPTTRRAFDLAQEPEALRDRYGRNVHGQRLLLARRLVEAGVRFVSVYWGGLLNAPDEYWDTHHRGFVRQREALLPPFDQALSAFLDDLDRRGLLESTLVVVMGEFGRTPKVGAVTANSNTDAQGRDHWPFCYSIVLAGGGVRGGTVVGRSDRFAAYPAADPYSPADLNATLYWSLGLDPAAEMHDPLNRPLPLSRGTPIHALFRG